MTLNMVHSVGEMRKSVDLLLLVSLDSNAILVLQCKSNIDTQCQRCQKYSSYVLKYGYLCKKETLVKVLN